MTSIIRLIHRHWLAITLFLLAVITYLSLTPLASLPDVPGRDKTHHFIAYAALVFAVALRKPKRWPVISLLLFGWSGGIEILQPYVNRYGEWLDLAANGGGLICGVILATVVSWLFPHAVNAKLEQAAAIKGVD